MAALAVSLAVGAGAAAYDAATQASHVPPLSNFRIDAPSDTELEVGQSIRLTAEGYYGTSPVVVKAVWNLLGDQGLGRFAGDCDGTPECTFVAAGAGTAVIEAEANHQFAHVSVDIRGPVQQLTNTFSDTLPNWAERPILDLNRRNIVRGYEDGRFGSADRLTRAQTVTLIARMLLHLNLVSQPGDCRQYYDDIPPGHFAYDAACIFWQRGWSTGLREFGGGEAATRTETAIFLYRILGVPLLEKWGVTLGDIEAGGAVYPDVPKDHYAFYETAVLHRAGIMTGHADGRFGPEETLNRAEAATSLHRALSTLETLGMRHL